MTDNQPTQPISIKDARVCPSCGSSTASNLESSSRGVSGFIYSVGRIEVRFPSLSVEKECAHLIGRSTTDGQTDRQALQKMLSEDSNRYLARHLCWVLKIDGFDSYIMQPRDTYDFGSLIATIRSEPAPTNLDLVIGTVAGMAPPHLCNGLSIPLVIFDKIYSFERDSVIRNLPPPEKHKAADFGAASQELFDRLLQLAANMGTSDEHRALNYCAVRYPAVYVKAAESFSHNYSLVGIEARTPPMKGGRKIVEIIFSYSSRSTDMVEKVFTRVDVTEVFPFLATKLSPYYA